MDPKKESSPSKEEEKIDQAGDTPVDRTKMAQADKIKFE